MGFVNVISERKDVVCIEHACQGKGDEFRRFDLLLAGDARGQTVVSFSPDPGLGRQLNLLEMLFDRMPMGIAFIDREYCIQRYNPTWTDFSERYAHHRQPLSYPVSLTSTTCLAPNPPFSHPAHSLESCGTISGRVLNENEKS